MIMNENDLSPDDVESLDAYVWPSLAEEVGAEVQMKQSEHV